MMLRSMQQAVYEPHSDGHFGLAYEAYAHFTSPIRRYPDLTVHRAIKAVLQGEKYTPSKNWQALGVHTSFCERRADDASRDVEDWLKTYYMHDKVGEIFKGKISGMTSFGIFVTLNDIHIDGLVHISDLGEDYFNFRPEIMAIEGERSGIRFSMGDKLTVKVARADLDTSKIDLVLVDTDTVAAAKKSRRKSSKLTMKAKGNRSSVTDKVKANSRKLSAKEIDEEMVAAKQKSSRRKSDSRKNSDKPKSEKSSKTKGVKVKVKAAGNASSKRKGHSKTKS